MSNDAGALVYIFAIAAVGALVLVLALAGVSVISQRKIVNMHRAHAQKLLQAQEDERAWVAREVHDDAVQRVAFITQQYDAIRVAIPELAASHGGELDAVAQDVKDLGVFLRSVAHRLHPSALDHGGLEVAVRSLAGEITRNSSVAVEVAASPIGNALAPASALALYRIAQEALRNVVNHSGAARAKIELSRSPTAVTLVVSDEGKGFESRTRRASDGIGLVGMQERATLAGGTVSVTSRPGQGTRVEATLPATPAPTQ
ncbi:MAG: hypothetical protein HOP28_00485 [Gemmatimonadales bacterium]|nr:hypothetical protein [Gemmatimonadales bacterium]